MTRSTQLFGLVVLLVMAVVVSVAPAAGPRLKPVAGFLKIPKGIPVGAASGVDIDSKGRIYLFHRGPRPILCFTAKGKFIRSWGDDLIGSAHGLRIDRDDNVWVTDIGHHMVFKFSSKGKLLLALGRADQAGTKRDLFDKPTDIGFGPKGEIYVSDGYGNSRVIKFDAQGKYLTQWGKPGKGQGEFDTPHAILVDRKGRVVVGDRENDRVQVFDANGKWLATWPGFAPFGLAEDSKGAIFVADGRANQVLQVDPTNGKVVSRWGSQGAEPGQFQLPHMLAVDKKGSLYVVEIQGKRLQKLRR
jgi:DNA-binding beta-propeller fold protein YncE